MDEELELTRVGRYELRRVLGRGAMGVVYEGYDPKLSRRVAIKTIQQEAALEAGAANDYAERFTREAKAAARISHPNIVQVYDFGVEGDIAYLVMEFVQGTELGAFFESGERFDIHDAMRLMTELLDALELAHNSGVIHRDIKPANVMVDGDGRAKLADFGVARVTDGQDATQAGRTMVGTPAYMSPEQIQGQKVDRRADLFSAGVILYQFLTGRKPFHGGGVYTLAKKILHDDPPRPSLIVESISPEFDRVVDRALAKKPEDRYQSALEFSEALNLALQGVDLAAAAAAAPVAAPAAAPPQAGASNRDLEIEFWRSIKESEDPEQLALFLRKFPSGVYTELAQRKLAKLQREAERKREEEEKAKLEARAKARREAEALARQEDERVRREAEARAWARREAEERARREAEEKARQAAQASAPVQAQPARPAPAVRVAPVIGQEPRPSATTLAEPVKGGSPLVPVLATVLVIAGAGAAYFALQPKAAAPAPAPAAVAVPAPAPVAAPAPVPAPTPAPAVPDPAPAKAVEDATATKAAADAAAAEKRAAAAERRAKAAEDAAKAAEDKRAADNRAALLRFATERALGDRSAADRLVTPNTQPRIPR